MPHSFVRTPDSTFRTFDAPGASGTFASSINPSGVVVGSYYVITNEPSFSSAYHGFFWAVDGTITAFDVPGAMWTVVLSNGISPAGAIAGYYQEADLVLHGYVRAPDGTFTSFDVPGAGTGAFQGTGGFGIAINPGGAIAGTYADPSNTIHGFLRAADGNITTFDPPGSTFTLPASINPAGVIAGYYDDADGLAHGFVRAK